MDTCICMVKSLCCPPEAITTLLTDCMLSRFSRVQLFATLWTVACQTALSMGFPSNNTGVDCHVLPQGIFLTQGLNRGLLHCRQILYSLSYREALNLNRIRDSSLLQGGKQSTWMRSIQVGRFGGGGCRCSVGLCFLSEIILGVIIQGGGSRKLLKD